MAMLAVADARTFWIQASVGIRVTYLPRAITPSDEVLRTAAPLVCGNLLEHPIYHDTRLVAGPPCLRFLASAPMIAATGEVLGVLTIADRVPRASDWESFDAFFALAAQGADIIERLAGRHPELGQPGARRAS